MSILDISREHKISLQPQMEKYQNGEVEDYNISDIVDIDVDDYKNKLEDEDHFLPNYIYLHKMSSHKKCYVVKDKSTLLTKICRYQKVGELKNSNIEKFVFFNR